MSVKPPDGPLLFNVAGLLADAVGSDRSFDIADVRIALPDSLSRYVVEKGSITVDGVSLTVSALGGESPDGAAGHWFEVSLIPTTLALTTLGRALPGVTVNLEVDVIAKYVERLLTSNGGTK